MTPIETEKLCLSLINCNDGREVLNLLKEYNLWDKEELWRPYGDIEGNWSTINAHGATDYCLNEKITNSIDAVLANKCWEQGINPEDKEKTPNSVNDAVYKFLNDPENNDENKRSHIFWSQKYRLKVAKNIFLSCGGVSGKNPTIAIADLGEGQTPEMVPNTFLSLQKSNKIGIDFVQGKWNQGGSGAMKYCGQGTGIQLQLIVTRRNPEIIKKFPEHKSNNTPRKDDWSFTIIKREEPSDKSKRSTASYLAPVGATNGKSFKGEILSFRDNGGIPFFPSDYDQCKIKSSYGSLTKLFDYNIRQSDAMRTGGLSFNIGWLLPRSPIPIRFHDARKGFKRKQGSFAYSIEGVANFLERTSLNDETSNLEKLEPSKDFIRVNNYKIEYDIFIFKKDKALQYKGRQGIIWSINGQAHATQPDQFFKADDLGYASIADHMLVVLKCDDIGKTDVEDIFASTRDKIDHGHKLVREIKKRLISQLKEHTGIQEIVRKRILEDQNKPPVQDQRILKQLQDIISETPLIENLDLGDLFKNKTKVEKKIGELKRNLKEFPTRFILKGTKDNKETLKRDAFEGKDVKFTFLTDAKNNYFTRRKDRAEFDFYWIDENNELHQIENTGGPFLKDGICKATIKLKIDHKAGDLVNVRFLIKDKKNTFECNAELNVRKKSESPETGKNKTKSKNKNKNQQGIELDDEDKHDLIIASPLNEEDWNKKFGERSWNKFEVLKVESYRGEDQKVKYLFYYNKDYIFLQNEQSKATPSNPAELIERKFQIALSLFGMSALSTYKSDKKNNRKSFNIDNPFSDSTDNENENKEIPVSELRAVEISARSIAMLILPTIKVVNKLNPKIRTTSSEFTDDN